MSRSIGTNRHAEQRLRIIHSARREDLALSERRRRGGIGAPALHAVADGGDRSDEVRAELRERTADLQRVKAEYDNYRKQVRRDRIAVGRVAIANVLVGLLPVLDAITEARRQQEVTGGFGRVVDLLETGLAGLGLQDFGEAGDLFDPTVHRALSYTPTGRFVLPTCGEILRPGYRVGDRLLRPADVEVAGPPPGEDAAQTNPGAAHRGAFAPGAWTTFGGALDAGTIGAAPTE